MLEQFTIIEKKLSVGKHSKIRIENTAMKMFSLERSVSTRNFSNKWNNNFSELKNRKLINLVKSEGHCCVSLNSLPHFLISEKFSKIVHLFRISYYLASRQQLMRNLDPIGGTRMYNQLLKLKNERREQKKMIEEKYSLKESVV